MTVLKYLYCYGNQLTSLNVSACTQLVRLDCYQNQISGDGMTTLVNSLPQRTASSPGTFRAIYNTGEGNSLTVDQIATASQKYWIPKQYNGSTWVNATAVTRGDVDADSEIGIADVTALINYLLTGNASGLNLANADCDQDSEIGISDVTTLINYLLTGNW